jgi:hypothetical protein
MTGLEQLKKVYFRRTKRMNKVKVYLTDHFVAALAEKFFSNKSCPQKSLRCQT